RRHAHDTIRRCVDAGRAEHGPRRVRRRAPGAGSLRSAQGEGRRDAFLRRFQRRRDRRGLTGVARNRHARLAGCQSLAAPRAPGPRLTRSRLPFYVPALTSATTVADTPSSSVNVTATRTLPAALFPLPQTPQ